METWAIEATKMFHKHRNEAKNDENIKELRLINAGKAVALSELLEMFGHKPQWYLNDGNKA